MAKRVTENHNISATEPDVEFEDMLNVDEQPVPTEESTADTGDNVVPDENLSDKTNAQKADKSSDKTNVVVLKKAASYSGCGLKFVKSVPTPVDDEAIYKRLLSTGLFIKG